MRLEATHDVADAGGSIDKMCELSIDFLVSSDSIQNVIADVAQNFTIYVDGGFGVRSFCVNIELHDFFIKLQVLNVDVDFEIASLRSNSTSITIELKF